MPSTETAHTGGLLTLPPETILQIFEYLDLPDLTSLSKAIPALSSLTTDPVLHLVRLRIIAPARVHHALFARGPSGLVLRPTVGDLVHRHVIRGLGIERRWRTGGYFNSAHSVKQYEMGLRIQRIHTTSVLAAHMRRRVIPVSNPTSHTAGSSASAAMNLRTLHLRQILPDIESSSTSISRTLLPTVRKLKWSFRRDSLARVVRGASTSAEAGRGLGAWLDKGGSALVKEGERVRLAICPSVKKIIGFYEGLTISR